MMFFRGLYEQSPFLVIAFAVTLAAIVLLFGYEWLSRRREDREDVVPVRPNRKAVDAAIGQWKSAIASVPDYEPVHPPVAPVLPAVHKPKRVNRHKAHSKKRHK